MEPDTSAAACCAASRRTDGPCARSPAGPSGSSRFEGVEPVGGDLLDGSGVEAALEGCSTAYYLVHSMEAAAGNGDFAGRDRRMAETFAEAAAAGGRRADRLPRRHRARRTVRCLPTCSRGSRSRRSCSPPCPASTALRASIVIGAGSSSFRILVRLVERLRVLPMPRWRDNRTQPIDERDVIEFLARTPAGARRRRAVARRGGPGRDDLRPHDRADRRLHGRRPPAAGASGARSRRPPARWSRP